MHLFSSPRRFVSESLVVVLLVFACGCATTIPSNEIDESVDLAGMGTMPDGGGMGGTGGGMGDMGGQWESLEQPLPDEGTGAGTGTSGEKRWENVAIYFAFDRSAIGAAQRPKLETLAGFLNERPDYGLVIEGHTDSRGSDEYNRGLSERRALAVKRYLVDLGIAGTRMETIPYGEDRPAVPGATSERQHAKNRRVEFVFRIP